MWIHLAVITCTRWLQDEQDEQDEVWSRSGGTWTVSRESRTFAWRECANGDTERHVSTHPEHQQTPKCGRNASLFLPEPSREQNAESRGEEAAVIPSPSLQQFHSIVLGALSSADNGRRLGAISSTSLQEIVNRRFVLSCVSVCVEKRHLPLLLWWTAARVNFNVKC